MNDFDDLRELDLLLQARGEALSANKVTQHLGGSKRDALKLLRAYRAETEAPPPTPAPPVAVLEPAVVAETPAPPPTLLAQAEAAYQSALMAERQVRRATDLATTVEERMHCQQAWRTASRAREAAESLMAQRARAKAALIAAIGPARIAARHAAGELAALEDEIRRRLVRARREAHQAQEELDRMVQDLMAIAGAQAVPRED